MSKIGVLWKKSGEWHFGMKPNFSIFYSNLCNLYKVLMNMPHRVHLVQWIYLIRYKISNDEMWDWMKSRSIILQKCINRRQITILFSRKVGIIESDSFCYFYWNSINYMNVYVETRLYRSLLSPLFPGQQRSMVIRGYVEISWREKSPTGD